MTPEHKQQAKQLIADWTNVSRTSTPAVWFLNADCMAGFLQELVDAPEVEPVAFQVRNDSGNTLLRIGEDDPMPTSPVRAVINDALKPCPEIDAVTREMADQAEIAYQVLSEALGTLPEEVGTLTLSELAETAAAHLQLHQASSRGYANFKATICNTLDLNTAASSMEILAEVENISRLADRTAPPAAQNERAGPYIIISDPRGAAGTYETIDEARPFAESTARRSTFGRSAIVSVVAEVELVPQWSDAK